MQTAFAQDMNDPDQAIYDAIAERPGLPIRLRLQPMIMRGVEGKTKQYQGWRQVSWTMECDNAAEAFATRDALRAFFETLGRLGPEAVRQALSAINAVQKVDEARIKRERKEGKEGGQKRHESQSRHSR